MMPQISEAAAKRLMRTITDFETRRSPWDSYWSEVARFIMPRRRVRPGRGGDGKAAEVFNPDILDGFGGIAVRTLAYGMMNGITSPARPWFRRRVPRALNTARVRRWNAEVQEMMTEAIDASNFYTAIAIQYLDLAAFQSSAMFIYEDERRVFRCQNFPIGQYHLANDNEGTVNRFGRTFSWRVEQIVKEFGREAVTEATRRLYDNKHFTQTREICHVVEPNTSDYEDVGVPRMFPYREVYWEKAATAGRILRARGFREWPGPCPRWEVLDNDDYGTGPSTDALPDIRQLQHMQRRKLQGIDKLIAPPLIADIQLQHREMSMLPNGVTFVAGANNVGVRPIYTVAPPIQEISQEIQRLEMRIRDHYYNDLFKLISSLDTVRSATEITALEAEKLVLIGPVHDRFQREALEVALKRIYGIMFRNGLFDPVPPEVQDLGPEFTYSSILSDARAALDAAPLERGVAFVGNLLGARPEVGDKVDWDFVVEDYFTKIGTDPRALNDDETVQEIRQQRAEAEAAAAAPEAAQTAKLLSETEVGGAASALDLMLGA